VNHSHTFAIRSVLEPLAWLVTLLLLYFGGERRSALQKRGIPLAKVGERPPDYRALGAFAALKLLSALAQPLLLDQVFPLGLAPHTAHIVYWAVDWSLYLASTICVFFVIGALLKNSLSPLPGLSSAAMIVFRWAAVLTLVIASTAHIPVYGMHNTALWLNEVSTSFSLCVCSFELSLLVLLTMQLGRLGMCLRSRPIGLAFGLAVFSLMDIYSALTGNASAHVKAGAASTHEAVVLCVLLCWAYYVVMPEPKRNPHSLPITSRLMRWNEIAIKLEVNGRQTEQTPFIAGVQLVVDGILDKYKIGPNL
jgi:hypothetical protein